MFARLVDHTHDPVVHVTGVQFAFVRQLLGSRHVPPTQALPAGHTTPQPPQLFAALDVSVSQPLAGFASQSPRFAPQTNPHVPRAHTGVALARAGHALPHAEQ